jgi:thiol:disulfide interchange protein
MRFFTSTTGLLVIWTAVSWPVAAQTHGGVAAAGLAATAALAATDSELTVSAEYRVAADGSHGSLSVTARPSGGWYIYSVTQQRGGPMPTQIVLQPSDDFELTGPFQPDNPPKTKTVQYFKVPVEEHHGPVTWTAPFRIAAGANPQSLRMEGKLNGQICDEEGGCIPLSTMDTRFVARRAAGAPLVAAGAVESGAAGIKRRTPPVDRVDDRDRGSAASPIAFQEAPADGYRVGTVHASLSGQLEPGWAVAGQQVTLTLTLRPDPGWHVYAYQPREAKGIAKPTLIAVTEPANWISGEAQASAAPTVKRTGIAIEPEQQYHEASIRWSVSIQIPADAAPGTYPLRGAIGYQTCSETQCDPPTGAQFEGVIQVGDAGIASADATPLRYAAGSYSAISAFLSGDRAALAVTPPPATTGAETIRFDPSQIQVDEGRDQNVLWILALAFVGGFVLNFMPCVLPVIGLKVMAFVQQAGEDRRRILMLNLWYAFGMLSIFWLLATLASAASLGLSSESLGWGEQFNYDGFTIPLLCVVFTMGLSFLGVWEIPIPGLAGSGRAAELAQQEGIGGAFFKGVITTILATPCSGPGLATALTWSATKPPSLVYLVFTFMGLGMALPYLAIGAFPRLIRFLPKPGAWMDTFKQLMGFVLMGTVVYMFTMLSPDHVIPTVALIFALWAGCWWIGRTSPVDGLSKKLTAWAGAAAFVAVIGWFAFGYERDKENELPWRPYSLAALDQFIRTGHTVMVDFTADW